MKMLLEGYASLFGVVDRERDVVRKGAFRETLAARPNAPLLLGHDPRLVADALGLRARGEIDPDRAAGALALKWLARGTDGLSIGYRVRASRTLEGGGRELVALDLVEVSLVSEPMAPAARLTRIGWSGAEAPTTELSHVA
ncbi:MAG: HK97 family phage prohead protease [Alphaproteobacteria bacterium]|nr:HK97 family phage prohead protease [Alphaproteobacteria bacterium]